MAAVFAHPSLIAITVFYPYLAWQHGRPLKETLYRTLPQFLTAIAACDRDPTPTAAILEYGIVILGSEENGSPLDDEQFACLEATLGAEALARLSSVRTAIRP